MFARFARAQDASSRMAFVAVLGGIVLVAWSMWFFLARVALYEVSRTARLEVASHDVDSPVSARLLRSTLVLDRTVQAGEVLVELDAESFRLERAAQESRLRKLGPRIEALRQQLASYQQAMHGEKLVKKAQQKEAGAHRRALDVDANQKDSERKRLQSIAGQGLVAAQESDRAIAEALQKRAEAEAAHAQAGRLGNESAVKISERMALIAGVEVDIAQLEGERADAENQVRILNQKIDLHVIRAPVAGSIGHMLNLRSGAMVAERTRLCTIVPMGGLRAVAFFDATTAAGRVQAGQPARLRMFGFPWTKYGMLQAQVDRVGNEPKDGLIRVELVLQPGQRTRIPLEHGLSASAEVEVERISPFALMLDAAGRFLMSAEGRSPAPTPEP
jgi:membrane fusion protein, adhesin transport system